MKLSIMKISHFPIIQRIMPQYNLTCSSNCDFVRILTHILLKESCSFIIKTHFFSAKRTYRLKGLAQSRNNLTCFQNLL